jgi:hypothetical protein
MKNLMVLGIIGAVFYFNINWVLALTVIGIVLLIWIFWDNLIEMILGGIGRDGNTEINDRELAEILDILKEKYGLYVFNIDLDNENILELEGDNAPKEDEYEEGEFHRKVRNVYDFKENLPKELKKYSHKTKYSLELIEVENDEDDIVVRIAINEKEKVAIQAPSKYMNLAEKLNIKDNEGHIALLVGYEEDEKTDNLVLAYDYVDGINNIKKWNSSIEVMKDILGFNFVIKNDEANREIIITKVPRLKTALEFYKEGFRWEDYLEKGKVFEGKTTEGPYFRSLRGLTHTGVAGQTGSGKSVQLHLTLKSIVYNMEHFEKIYLGDLKGGLELSFLEDLKSDKLSFFGEAHEVLPIILNCELEMDARMAYMKANRIKNIIGNIILFIVDEYKQLNDLQMGKSGVSREVGNLIVSKIDRISALGRAMNVKLFLQSQNFTVDSIESSTRNNIQSLVLMKTKNPEIQNACIPYTMREEMPNPADFTTGKKILLDSETGETTLIQALFTEAEEDITIDNTMKAYKMGQENQDEVKNIEADVLPFKLKILERHLDNENLIDEVREYYEAEYNRLTGGTIEADVINEDSEIKVDKLRPPKAKKVSKEDEEIKAKVEKNKQDDDDLMNKLENLLVDIKK